MGTVSSSTSYSFSRDYYENLNVLYSYSESNPLLEGLALAYSFTDGSSNDSPPTGGRAAATQKILNNMPYWMDMRLNRNSNTQKFVHAWGFNLEDITNHYFEHRAEQFLITSNPYIDIHTGVSELSFAEERVYTPEFRNLIYNSSFSIKSFARSQKPDGWAVDRSALDDITFDTTNSIFGDNGIKLSGSSAIKQIIALKKLSGKLAFSIYANSLVDTGSESSEKHAPDEGGMILVIKFADSTVSSYGVGFYKNTYGEWIRPSIVVDITKETSSIEVIIVNNTGTDYVIDLPSLEESANPSSWTPSKLDIPFYIDEGSPKRVAAVHLLKDTNDSATSKKLEVYEATSEKLFSDTIVPTRIERYVPLEDPGHAIDLSLGRQITAEGEIMPVLWSVSSGKLREESLTTPDVFVDVDVRDIYKAQDGELYLDNSTDSTVKAAATLRDYLMVVTQETYLGKTAYYLKFVRPNKISYEDSYVQSISDLELPINLNQLSSGATSEDVSRIGLCKNIPFCIFVDTTLDRRFYFKLHFDYYYADFGVRKLFCREHYLRENAYLQII